MRDETTNRIIGKAHAGDDLAEFTPVEIDTALAHLYGQSQALQARIDSYNQSIWNIDHKGHRYAQSRDDLAEKVAHLEEEQSYVTATFETLEDEWDRRGRWTRAFLVNNSNGHVHRWMGCSTCFPSTQYVWMTDFSAKDEAEIVEAAGERACTVCYPSAPVEVLSRPTQMFTPDEVEKQRAREEREAKKAAKAAAEITVEGYYDYSNRPRTKVFKTERAVTNDIAAHLSSLCWYGNEHPSAHEWVSNVSACLYALRQMGVEYDYDKAVANARKKVTREGGTPKF